MKRTLLLVSMVPVVANMGCATVVLEHLGRPATLPASTHWCSEATLLKHRPAQSETLAADSRCAAGDHFCAESAALIRPCIQALARDHSAPAGTPLRGTIKMGLSTDAAGKATDLCVIDSDLGETPQTLSCISERVNQVTGLDPDLTEALWNIRLFLG